MQRDLNLEELSQVTTLHVGTLRRLARLGKLPGVYRVGRRWLISRDAMNRLRNVPVDGAAEEGLLHES